MCLRRNGFCKRLSKRLAEQEAVEIVDVGPDRPPGSQVLAGYQVEDVPPLLFTVLNTMQSEVKVRFLGRSASELEGVTETPLGVVGRMVVKVETSINGPEDTGRIHPSVGRRALDVGQQEATAAGIFLQ